MKKRILSWLLVLSMAVSCLPVTVLAAESATPAFTPFYEGFDGYKDGDNMPVVFFIKTPPPKAVGHRD